MAYKVSNCALSTPCVGNLLMRDTLGYSDLRLSCLLLIPKAVDEGG